MTLLRRTLFSMFLLMGIVLVHPLPAAAQVDLYYFDLMFQGASGLTEFVQGDCFDFDLGSGAAGVTLDIEWAQDGVPQERISGWPTLDSNGRADNICTSGGTTPGLRTFTRVRDSAWGANESHWLNLGYNTQIYYQPTSVWFSPASGYAGVGGTLLHVDGVANQNVEIRYVSPLSLYDMTIPLDVSGNYAMSHDHYALLGNYYISFVRDPRAQPGNLTFFPDNNPQVPPPTYQLRPPQPQTLTWNDTTTSAGVMSQVYAGGDSNGNFSSFKMRASNGGAMTIDYKYTINGGTEDTQSNWPYLSADTSADTNSANSKNGHSANVFTSRCTPAGPRVFTQVKNHSNSDWKDSPNSTITVIGAPQPSLSTVSPAVGLRGQTVTVTITGNNLCGVTLSTSHSGLSFTIDNNKTVPDNPDWSDGTSMTASFNVASNAATGNAQVTLWARGYGANDSVPVPRQFYFQILPPPTITGISPSTGIVGTSVPITLSGTGLGGATLSCTWSTVTFSNVQIAGDGNSLTATMNISGSATANSQPPIKVTTAAGEATSTAFTTLPLPAPTLTNIGPTWGMIGTNASVTLTGTYLIGPGLSTTYSGVTFSNVTPSSDGNSVTATFQISSSAAEGQATIKLTTAAGNATKLFNINTAIFLSKEYIYLGDRVIAVVAP